MKFLDENHHVSWSLDDLVGAVVRGRKHGGAGIHVEAARNQGEILCLIVLSALLAPFRRQVGSAFLSLCGYGRDPSVGRVDDQRCSQIWRECGLAPVQPELRVVVVDIRNRSWRGFLSVTLSLPLRRLEEFLFRIELFRHAVGPLQRRNGVVGPVTLQVGLSVRRFGHGPWLCSDWSDIQSARPHLYRLAVSRQRHQEHSDEHETENRDQRCDESLVHLNLLFEWYLVASKRRSAPTAASAARFRNSPVGPPCCSNRRTPRPPR